MNITLVMCPCGRHGYLTLSREGFTTLTHEFMSMPAAVAVAAWVAKEYKLEQDATEALFALVRRSGLKRLVLDGTGRQLNAVLTAHICRGLLDRGFDDRRIMDLYEAGGFPRAMIAELVEVARTGSCYIDSELPVVIVRSVADSAAARAVSMFGVREVFEA